MPNHGKYPDELRERADFVEVFAEESRASLRAQVACATKGILSDEYLEALDASTEATARTSAATCAARALAQPDDPCPEFGD